MCRTQGETLQEVEGSKRCTLPSRCHCHSLSLAPVNPDCFYLPGFTFLVTVHPGSPGHSPRNRKTVVVVACAKSSVCNVYAKYEKHEEVATQ